MRKTTAFLLGGGGFLAGLGVGTFWLPSLFTIGVGIVSAFLILLIGWRQPTAKRMAIFLLFVGLGLAYVTSLQRRVDRDVQFGQITQIAGTIIDCRQGFGSFRCTLDARHPRNARVAALLPQKLSPGEQVVVRGRVMILPEKYLFMRGDGVSVWLASPQIVETSSSTLSIRKILAELKIKSEQRLHAVLPEPSASLASGLLFGSRQYFTDDFYDALKRTNTLHIVAVSGFNITILAEFIRRFFIRMPRKISFIVSSLAIASFVAMIGAPASAVRAAIMGVILLFGRLIGRKPYTPSQIIFTALLMAIPNPYILRYDTGFQLSYLAFVGLVGLAPLLERYLGLLPKPVRGIGAATLGATLATLPILIPLSGTISLVGPIVNIVILPLVPLIMLLSGILLLVGFLSVGAANVLGLLMYLPSLFVVKTIEKASLLPFATSPWTLGIASMLLLAAILILLRKQHAQP